MLVVITGLGALAASPGALSQAQQVDAASQRAEASVEQVTVTARRVSENLQSTPVPVSAFGEAQLERLAVQNATDLSGVAPNVQIAQTGAGTGAMQVFIRGIGLNALAFNLENPVGVYLDDVYLGRIQGSLLDMLDFERIEILRGPQGTLYGRNSTVGALKYVTRGPDLNDAHFRGEATFGDYARADARVSASAPVIPGTLALKFDAATRSQDGYIIGVDAAGVPTGERGNGIHRQSARVAAVWLPAENWKVDLTADYAIDRSGSTQGTPITSVNPPGPCNSAVAPCRDLFGSPYEAGLNNANSGHNLVAGGSARVEFDTGWGSFKSISSFRRLNGLDAIDFTAVPGAGSLLPDHKRQNQISQELQLASRPGQRLTWITGLFYFREHINHNSNFVFLQLNDDHQTSNSYAAFGDATYELFEAFHVDLGARVSKDDKKIDRAILPENGGPDVLAGSGSFSTNKTTYKVGFDYALTTDILAYATYSTGYRPGSYASTYAFPPVTPVLLGHTSTETASNVEVGVKSQWLDNRLRLNATAFHTNYNDLQQQSSTFPYPITTYNIALKGAELEVEARPLAALMFYASLGLLDAHISSGPQDGVRPRFTPKVQYSAGGEYRVPVAQAELFAGANVVYTSKFTTDDANIPSVTQDCYALFAAQLGLEFRDGKYRVSIDGKNLSNKVYFLATSPDSEKFYAPPRTIAGTFSVRF